MKKRKYGFLTLLNVFLISVVFAVSILSLSSCKSGVSGGESTTQKAEIKKISVVLDWVPNTNHTGIYVARDKGFYNEEGLEVDIVQPTEGGAADLIAAGKGEFGISYQEQVTYARTAEPALPVKAIAAIIQHNTSGFASPAEKNIKTPKDFEGKKYGGWGTSIEEAMLKALMEKYGADFSKLQIINIGASDFFTSVQKDVDFSWIYYGWDGIAAEVKNFKINFIKLQDLDENLDFYTPVIIASEENIKNNPELIKKFLKATSKGYEFAIKYPDEAAQILLKAVPELDKNIIVKSQQYLAKQYQAEAPKWGVMDEKIWENFSKWMFDKKLINKELDYKNAYTNEFMP
ncbi:MAG: ABC transporter substrate-binding protein [Actinobacteria bacterium]|nr:ABC transporter substrate-binding protein [Actinomycetota bacterium]